MKNKQRIIAIVTAMFISVAFMPVNADAVYVNSIEDIVYEKYDDTYHCFTDASGEMIKEKHSWVEGALESKDEFEHTINFTCEKCGTTKEEKEYHDYEELPPKWSKDEYGYYYGKSFKCKCGEECVCKDEDGLFYTEHDFSSYSDGEYDFDESVEYNSKYHLLVWDECWHCGSPFGYELERHKFVRDYYKINSKNHTVDEYCNECDFTNSTKEKHKKTSTKVLKKATIKRKGKIQDVCACGYVLKTKKVSWKYNTKYSLSYDVTWNTDVYRNSKHITVTLKNPFKGSTVIVQIGKKKYKKKVYKGKKVKIKIKKPKKYGQKIYIDVKYKGKWIGTTAKYGYDTVYYAKSIKKGMTKKQFKHTRYYWGAPDDTASGSGGWSYWYYDDGSYIGFKHGKIKYWYDAD